LTLCWFGDLSAMINSSNYDVIIDDVEITNSENAREAE
jgi:hypothetical protein